MTTTMTAAPKMTSSRRTLKADRTFTRSREGVTFSRTFPAGTVYTYERTESDTEIIHTATYWADGVKWTSQEKEPKDNKPVTTPTEKYQAIDRTQRQTAPIIVTIAVPETAAEVDSILQNVANKAEMADTAAKAMHNLHSGAMAAAGRTASRAVRGTDAMERTINQQTKVVEALGGELYQVNYYIPVEFNDTLANPSNVFRRHGVRLDGSNWVFTAEGLNHKDVQAVFANFDAAEPIYTTTPLGYVEATEVEYWAVRYHPDEVAKIRAKAQVKLHKELVRIHTSLITRLGTAADALRAAEEALAAMRSEGQEVTERDQARVANANVGSIRGTLRDAIECFSGALAAAEAFDETANLADLFAGVRAAIRTEAMAFNARLRAEQRTEVKLPTELA